MSMCLQMYQRSQLYRMLTVDTLISLELGSAMRVSVLKLDCTSFDVAVMNSATVKDLKPAVEKKSMKWSSQRWVIAIFPGEFYPICNVENLNTPFTKEKT
ncbi:putative U11/U12 small nuclear ribonucleoprotein 25kDa protein [Helianthus debilis subsp. tardiflorus]